MLPQENYLFGCTRSKSSQGSVPAGLALASDFSFCFQCKVGSSLVLRRPIETTRLMDLAACSEDNFRLAAVRRHSHLRAARTACVTLVVRRASAAQQSAGPTGGCQCVSPSADK